MPPRLAQASAICGLLAGPALFLGTLAGAFAQPDEFSIVDHASSDLGAMTADSAWLSNVGSNLAGFLLFVFAIGLWRSLGRRPAARIGSVLVGLAAVATFLTGVFRLDCRDIDEGCEPVSSWHANAHIIDAGITVIAFLLAPFVLAWALRSAQGWPDLTIPTLCFGVGTIVVAVVGGAIGPGFASLLAVLVRFAWITVLALRMQRLSRATRLVAPSLADPQARRWSATTPAGLLGSSPPERTRRTPEPPRGGSLQPAPGRAAAGRTRPNHQRSLRRSPFGSAQQPRDRSDSLGNRPSNE
jgi:hypothetical membrane protein